jgi:hypothetical protein
MPATEITSHKYHAYRKANHVSKNHNSSDPEHHLTVVPFCNCLQNRITIPSTKANPVKEFITTSRMLRYTWGCVLSLPTLQSSTLLPSLASRIPMDAPVTSNVSTLITSIHHTAIHTQQNHNQSTKPPPRKPYHKPLSPRLRNPRKMRKIPGHVHCGLILQHRTLEGLHMFLRTLWPTEVRGQLPRYLFLIGSFEHSPGLKDGRAHALGGVV